MCCRSRLLMLPLLAGLLALAEVPRPALAADTWPSFQNGGHPGVQLDAGHALQFEEELTWSTPITGYGQSSPVIWDGHVYVTSVEGDQKQSCIVTAVDLASGERLWEGRLNNVMPQENNGYISRAAPTPAADARGVICLFEGGNLVALTHAGEMRWEKNLVAEYGNIGARHGLSASVEQDADAVYIWIERSDDPYVLCVEKESGEVRWKSPGLGTTSWASPRLVPVDEGSHLVLSGIGQLAGLDPQTGQRLWHMEGINGNSTPTPVPAGPGQFLIGATVGRGEDAGEGRSADSNGLVQIERSESGAWSADYAWRAQRATTSFGSPIPHQGTALFVNRTGVLFGLDLKTGKEQFTQRLGDSIWATPLSLGEQVLLLGKSGELHLLQGHPERPQISTTEPLPPETSPAPAPTTGSPAGGPPSPADGRVLYGAAWADGLLLLREGSRLHALRGKPVPGE